MQTPAVLKSSMGLGRKLQSGTGSTLIFNPAHMAVAALWAAKGAWT